MRVDKLKQLATIQHKPDTFAVFNPTNIIYLTGFQGATALLIPPEGEGVLFVSGVNYLQAKAEVKGFKIELLDHGESVIKKIALHTQDKKLAVDTLPIESWQALSKAVGGEEKLEAANRLIHELRAVKDNEEIKFIREACKMADLGIEAASQVIRAGSTTKQIAAEAEYAMRSAGSEGVAFETIVSCGVCCSYPHGSMAEKTVGEGDFVMVDLGATHHFYHSDITRTFIAGKPTEKQRLIYETVKRAQEKVLEAIKPEVLASELDYTARSLIEESRFGEFFVHNLGHGVGLEVHEAPILGPKSKDVLTPGNIVTVEPGIYVPDFGGVRIEDTVLVTATGAEKLTKAHYLL